MSLRDVCDGKFCVAFWAFTVKIPFNSNGFTGDAFVLKSGEQLNDCSCCEL